MPEGRHVRCPKGRRNQTGTEIHRGRPTRSPTGLWRAAAACDLRAAAGRDDHRCSRAAHKPRGYRVQTSLGEVPLPTDLALANASVVASDLSLSFGDRRGVSERLPEIKRAIGSTTGGRRDHRRVCGERPRHVTCARPRAATGSGPRAAHHWQTSPPKATWRRSPASRTPPSPGRPIVFAAACKAAR